MVVQIDLSVALEVESMGEEDYVELRSKRAAMLAAINPETNGQKGNLRQQTNINNIREKTEKLLRSMAGFIVDNSPNNVNRKFTEPTRREG